MNGKPIIQLPEKIVEVVEKRMTADESVFYRQVESRSQKAFFKFVEEGYGQNYHHILVSFIRLPFSSYLIMAMPLPSLGDEPP